MSLELTLRINTLEHKIPLNEDATVSEVLARLTPDLYQHVSPASYPLPLWVLVNNQYLLSAYETSVMQLNDTSVITFPFAYSHRVFQYIMQRLREYGIQLDSKNIALCTFTLYIWYVRKIIHPEIRAMQLTQLYSHLFLQPESFVQAYESVLKEKRIVVSENATDFSPLLKKENSNAGKKNAQ